MNFIFMIIKFIFGLFFVFYGIYQINDIIMIRNQYEYNLRLYKKYFEYEIIIDRLIIPNINLLILINNLCFIYGGVLSSLNYGGKIYLCLSLIFEFILIFLTEFNKNELNISPLFTYLSLLGCILSI